jgi:chlorobactene glucosyltransferase
MHVLAGIVLAFWILIFIQTIANLAAVPRLRRDQTPQNRPSVSIVVPARNEARTIERSVRAFLAQDYDNFEVIVVNDRSTDGTGDILGTIVDPRLTIIDGAETPEGWLGKPWAVQQGTARARGEWLLIADADLIYSLETLRAAIAESERTGAALTALFPHFELGSFGEHAGMPMVPFFGFCFAPVWRANASQSPRLAMGAGSGNLIRREALESAGGFASLKDAVVDDIALARLVRRHGGVTRVARADDLISVRMYHSAAEIAHGFTKNIFIPFGRSFVAGTFFLLLLLITNLLPYALLFDRVMIAAVALMTLTRIVLFRSLRYPMWNAILLHPLMIAFWAYIFLRSMWFTGVRNELRWRGRVYDAAQTRFGAER